MMLFGEKYPDPARMVTMGKFSRELCGGTHLSNTAEVGALEIIAEEGVAAGTRRITALTGAKAEEHLAKTKAALHPERRFVANKLKNQFTAWRTGNGDAHHAGRTSYVPSCGCHA